MRNHEHAPIPSVDRCIGIYQGRRRPGGEKLRRKMNQSREWLVEEYHNKCRSVSDIANELGVGATTVCRNFKQLGIPIRTHKIFSEQAHRNMSEARRGNKNWLGKHHSEESKRKMSETKNGKPGHPHTPESIAKISQSRIGERNPNRNGNARRDKKASPETIKKLSDSHKGHHPSPETLRKKSESMRGEKNWNYGKRLSPETRRKLSAYRGEKASNWKGGISFAPYCPKFNKTFKESIRDKFGHKCYICSAPETADGYKHSVHHIDYNKNSICNGQEWAFVLLCRKHHAMSNNNRWYWFNLLICYWCDSPEINYCWGI